MKNIDRLIQFLPGGGKILWSAVFVVMFSLFFLVFDRERDFKKDLSIRKANSYIEGIRIISKKDGVDSWEITARRADFNGDETVAVMETVALDMKKDKVLLNADSGIYNINTRDLFFKKNITIRLKDSLITANNLAWNPSKGALTSDGPVRLEGSKFRVEGEGLAATENNKVRLMRNVKATFF